MSRIWFTADTHFGHANVIRHCDRPYSTVEEMDQALIQNWNETVAPNDTVWHLGDFAWGGTAHNYYPRLNGRIYIVLGNHDDDRTRALNWPQVYDISEIKIKGQRVVMCHYPMRSWNQSHRGSLMLYGHCHGKAEPIKNSLDVGVDCWNYRPISLDQIKERLSGLV